LRSCVTRRVTVYATFLALLAFSTEAQAQRIYSIGAAVDLVGGMDNNPQLTLPLLTTDSAKRNEFYSIYPAVSLESTGARSVLNANYAFGWHRLATEEGTESQSHAASLAFTRQVGARSNLVFSDSYSRTHDIQTFYALRGIQQTPEDVVFLFSPIRTNQAFTTNQAAASFSHGFSQRSTLSISGEHSLRLYDTAGINNTLSDQQVIGGTVGYSRRFNERLAWTLQFSSTYFHFDTFNNDVSSVVRSGFTYVLGKNTVGSFTVGPSHARDLSTSETHLSYELIASLQHKIKDNNFHFLFVHDNGTVTGVGSISKAERASVAFFRSLGQRVNISFDGTAFDSTGILDNSIDTRGVSASGNVGVKLARNLSLNGGVQYQRYLRPNPYEVSQRRVFVSLRYTHPNLLRFQ
jgi:hypothetical protein